jgi:hypothetical protein
MKYIQYLILIFTTFLTPIQPLLYLMFFFILLDTAFGIYASIKIEGMKSFRSHKLFNVVSKTFFYSTTIILTYLMSIYIFETKLFGVENLLSKGVTMLWIFIEMKSIDETSMKCGNKSIWVLLKELIDKVKSIKSDINDVTN